jgi:hypothetical protein
MLSAAFNKTEGANIDIEIDAFVCCFGSEFKFAVENVDITYGIQRHY